MSETKPYQKQSETDRAQNLVDSVQNTFGSLGVFLGSSPEVEFTYKNLDGEEVNVTLMKEGDRCLMSAAVGLLGVSVELSGASTWGDPDLPETELADLSEEKYKQLVGKLQPDMKSKLDVFRFPDPDDNSDSSDLALVA